MIILIVLVELYQNMYRYPLKRLYERCKLAIKL